MTAAWMRFWFAPGPARRLGACRLLFFGAIFVWQLPLQYAAWGTYSEAVWFPIWMFERTGIGPLPAQWLGVVAAVWKLSLLLAAVGLFTRAATGVSLLLGTYLLGLPQNFGQTQHYDTLVLFVIGALALSRCGDAWSIDALMASVKATVRGRVRPQPADSGEYTWPIRFVWVVISTAFFAAGLAKLRRAGLEWVFSDHLAFLLVQKHYRISDADPITTWGLAVAQLPWLVRPLAGVTMLLELLFPLAIFSGRARVVIIPAGIAFLAGVRLLMGPPFQQFAFCQLFWVPWDRVADALRARLGRKTSSAATSGSLSS